MELLSTNAGKVRREVLNGRSFLVAPVRMIVPGVLNGSQGALLYPEEEVSRDPISWNGMPLTLGHPSEGGRNVSARSPSVFNGKTMGWVWNSFVNGGNLDGEAWFDEDLTRRVSPQVHNLLLAEKPIELSTGLFTDNHPAAPGAIHNGRSYQFVARNYRPDHLAVLLDQKGACSIEDGCGVNVNQECTCGGTCNECKTKNASDQTCPDCGGEMVDGKCSKCGYVANAVPNQVRSQVTGHFKPYGAGAGKGPVHEAAQAGHLMISDRAKELGADAARQLAESGHNPPSWATDEATWERAKEAAAKGGHEEDWPYVVAIYQKMGGTTSGPTGNFNPERQGESDMALQQAQREALIHDLATNCSCWKGDVANLSKLPDERLQALKASHEEGKGLTAVVNALKEKKGAATLTVNEMPAFIKEKIEAKEEKEAEAENKTKNKTKNADPDSEEEEDEDEEDAAMNKTKNKAKNAEATANAVKAYLSSMTPKQWLEAAPAEVQSVIGNALKVEKSAKDGLIAKLTANLQGDAKTRLTQRLSAKPLDELQDLAALVPTANAKADKGPQTLASFFGAAEVLTPNVNSAFDGSDVLPLPGCG